MDAEAHQVVHQVVLAGDGREHAGDALRLGCVVRIVAQREVLTTRQLDIDLAPERFRQLKERRRTLAGRTGCGLCGTESLEQVVRDIAPLPGAADFPVEALYAGMAALPAQQALPLLREGVSWRCRPSFVSTNSLPNFTQSFLGKAM